MSRVSLPSSSAGASRIGWPRSGGARERGETVLFLAETPGRAERIVEMAADYSLLAAPLGRTEDAHAAALLVGLGSLSRGFRLPEGQLVVYAETDVFEEERRGAERRQTAGARVPVGPARSRRLAIPSSMSITASESSSD